LLECASEATNALTERLGPCARHRLDRLRCRVHPLPRTRSHEPL